jgi:hypothetical protein
MRIQNPDPKLLGIKPFLFISCRVGTRRYGAPATQAGLAIKNTPKKNHPKKPPKKPTKNVFLGYFKF